jgi:hypothetical protein
MPTTEGELVIEIKTINDLNKSICYILDNAMREIFVDNDLPDYDDFEELISEEVIEVGFNHYEVAGDFLNWRNMNNMDLEAVCDYVMTTEDNVFGEYTPQIPFNFRDFVNKYCYWWAKENIRYLKWYKVLKNVFKKTISPEYNEYYATAPLRQLLKRYVKKKNLKKIFKINLPCELVDEVLKKYINSTGATLIYSRSP